MHPLGQSSPSTKAAKYRNRTVRHDAASDHCTMPSKRHGLVQFVEKLPSGLHLCGESTRVPAPT